MENSYSLEFLASMLLVVMKVRQSCVKKEGFILPLEIYMCLHTKKCAAMKVRVEINKA